MDKYRQAAEKKLKGQHPDMIAKEALNIAEFSSRERENFFDNVYGELLVEYFINWLKTDPCLLYTSPSPRDRTRSRMPSSA